MALPRVAEEGTLVPTSMVDNSSVSPGRLPLMRVLRVMRPRTGMSNGRPEDPWKLTLMFVLRVMRQRTGRLRTDRACKLYLHPLCQPQRLTARHRRRLFCCHALDATRWTRQGYFGLQDSFLQQWHSSIQPGPNRIKEERGLLVGYTTKAMAMA